MSTRRGRHALAALGLIVSAALAVTACSAGASPKPSPSSSSSTASARTDATLRLGLAASPANLDFTSTGGAAAFFPRSVASTFTQLSSGPMVSTSAASNPAAASRAATARAAGATLPPCGDVLISTSSLKIARCSWSAGDGTYCRSAAARPPPSAAATSPHASARRRIARTIARLTRTGSRPWPPSRQRAGGAWQRH